MSEEVYDNSNDGIFSMDEQQYSPTFYSDSPEEFVSSSPVNRNGKKGEKTSKKSNSEDSIDPADL